MKIRQPANAVSLFFKYEEIDMGPLYWVLEGGKYVNVVDSEIERLDGGFAAAWFTVSESERMARHFGVSLEEF